MAKLYTKDYNKKSLSPKRETVSFLLNYSKSTWIFKTKFHQLVKLNLN